jgi:hypothetical protein
MTDWSGWRDWTAPAPSAAALPPFSAASACRRAFVISLSSCTVRPCGSLDFFLCAADSDDEAECIDMDTAGARGAAGSVGYAAKPPDEGMNEGIVPEGTALDGSKGDGAPSGGASYAAGGKTQPSTAPLRNTEMGGFTGAGIG